MRTARFVDMVNSGGRQTAYQDMNSQQIDHETRLAKQIEAGLLAQDILDGGTRPLPATDEELHFLVEEGRRARDELVLAHLGLVSVIAAESSRFGKMAFPDLFQEGCLALQQAVMSYDWRKGAFGPYAGMWIRAAVRRVTAQPWVPIEQVEVADPGGSQVVEQSVTRAGLARVLELIPSGQRDVIRLRTGWGGQALSRKDTADQLGITIAKVRLLESDGIAQMRRHWALAEAA